jgi:hypothetical protein
MNAEWHKQQRLQSAMNTVINKAVQEFLETHPETAWPTTRDALTDAKYDAHAAILTAHNARRRGGGPMTEAPEKMWVFPKDDWFIAGASNVPIVSAGANNVEYTRTDIADARIAELEREIAELTEQES